jgi:hypothetical protein
MTSEERLVRPSLGTQRDLDEGPAPHATATVVGTDHRDRDAEQSTPRCRSHA